MKGAGVEMNKIYYLVILYLVLINLAGFAIMGIDKKRAKADKRRIKEKTLFLIAIMGGSIGSVVGMRYFHHKTKHKSFVLGMPFLIILQVLIITFLYNL